MRYFKKTETDEVFGYEPEAQDDLIAAAVAAGLEEITGAWPPPLPSFADIVPNSITKRQLMLALLSMGLLDTVEASISSSDNRELKINWEYGTNFERSHTLVSAVAMMLSKTDEEVDDLFRLAATK